MNRSNKGNYEILGRVCAPTQEAQRGKRLKVADVEANRMPGSPKDPVASEMHTEGCKGTQDERREGRRTTKPGQAA